MAQRDFGIPSVPTSLDDEAAHRTMIANLVNTILRGGLNVVYGSFTLTPSATSTPLIDSRIRYSSFISFEPQTANAATARQSLYWSPADLTAGQAIIRHASNAAVDQTFTVMIIG